MSDFEGKVAVVTGGSRGMGRAMVEAFSAAGADVVIASRKFDVCREVAEHVSAEHGVRAFPYALNVSDWDECGTFVEEVYREFGHVDVLVNNAGLSPHYPSLDGIEEGLYDKVMDVNLKGPFRLCAGFGTRMAKTSRGGSIVNIGSVSALRPMPRALPYSAAKMGLQAMSEGFAQAFGPAVRVNTVHPGAFLTDISENWGDGVREELESQVALGRCAEASEIVGAVLYLASPAASFVTGAALRVDGGWM